MKRHLAILVTALMLAGSAGALAHVGGGGGGGGGGGFHGGGGGGGGGWAHGSGLASGGAAHAGFAHGGAAGAGFAHGDGFAHAGGAAGAGFAHAGGMHEHGEGMHEHGTHFARSGEFGSPYSPQTGFNSYGGFAYSPFTDCSLATSEMIGQNFDCGHVIKARVR